MPLYDYKCHKCGKVFEVKQSFSDDLLTTHEECGGALERLISAPALQFKGSGFYITDYARGGSGSNSGSNGKSDSSKSDSSKSESKSETKTDSTTSSTSTDTSKK